MVADNRLLLIDYSTHLEVLVANLLLAAQETRSAIINHANVEDLESFRCVIQLKHAAAPSDGVKLTPELRGYIETFKALATCWRHDEKTDAWTLDFFVNEAMREGFSAHFKNAATLYRAFHKIALLNDLAIPRAARRRLEKEIDSRRFASRLPEPQDEDKVFRFEQVGFRRRVDGNRFSSSAGKTEGSPWGRRPSRRSERLSTGSWTPVSGSIRQSPKWRRILWET